MTNAFDKVIGYDAIKKVLAQIIDMVQNKDKYTALGASIPHGVLMYGKPGMGKTLMAKCFISASGLTAYTVRRNKGSNEFVEKITETFRKAKETAPCIVFLDDLDKFANEDDNHRDAEEYVAVQAGIDDITDSQVLVIATANDVRKLPFSLTRSGRFDHKICFCAPEGKDAENIIHYYLSNKKISDSVNLDDLNKMISYSSCSDLEAILNDAAVHCGYEGKDAIDMDDLIYAVLSNEYTDYGNEDEVDENIAIEEEAKHIAALHEAGHLVISEILVPESIGLVSIRPNSHRSYGGFTHRCKNLANRRQQIAICLGGKAAVEMYYPAICASGCSEDMNRAVNDICEAITVNGKLGIGGLNIYAASCENLSESYKTATENIIRAELERNLFIVRDILNKNRAFLEKVTNELVKRGTLLASDIRKIKESVAVMPCAV